MKISVVTPTFNYGRFLGKALESVFAQSEADGAPAVEHIVMDGGSTDGTADVLRAWAEAHPATERYSFSFVSEPDKGQTDAINKGLRRATGDVVCWLNADEWYDPGALAKVAAAFARWPGADLVHGEVRFVDAAGKALRVKRDHVFSGFVLLWNGCYIPSAATFWRRKFLDSGVFLDASYKVTMDFEYWVRLWRLGCRFRFLPATLASFTWHETNVSEVFSERRRVERNRVQDLYAPRPLRTGRGRARLARPLGFLAHQLRRALVVHRLLFLPKDAQA